MDEPGPSGLRNIFELFENDDNSGDEDFDIAGLENEDNESDSDDDSDDERHVSVTGTSSSRSSTPTADVSEWVPVVIPEPENVISDPGFTVRNSESVQNISGKTFFPCI